MNIYKISKHPFQVYRISHLLPFNTPYTAVPKVSVHQITQIYLKLSSFKPESSITTGSNSRNVSNGSLVLGINGKSKKWITYNETCLTISIAYLIISEGLYFNIYQKPISKKILELVKECFEDLYSSYQKYFIQRNA